MEVFEALEAICRAMSDPAFYPHLVSCIKRIDTHISVVFLTGEWVYKLKKPVDFGFLDFREIKARRLFCEQEVRLNERLSHGVYRGVLEIRKSAEGQYSIEGAGGVVEYAVKMKQLPQSACLVNMLDPPEAVALMAHGMTGCETAGKGPSAALVDEKHMERLGARLAAFYAKSERSADIDRYGSPEVIAGNMEENFRQTQPFVGRIVTVEQWEFIREVSRAFFRYRTELFQHRVDSGRIRDGHGDLRAEHVYFEDGIQIIDCIEFNDRFRYGDVVSDLAFLHMDMEHLGHAELSRIFLSSYVKHAGDPALYALLDFYSGYRAVVKLKVSCFRHSELEDEIERDRVEREIGEYERQAYRYALRFSRPTLWIFCGLPASGKSSLASGLAEALSLKVFQSDVVRKESEGLGKNQAVVVPYGSGFYRRERRNLVYAGLLALAQEELKHGRSVILDASFSRRKWRDDARELARNLDTNFIQVECVCNEDEIRRRLIAREQTPGASDARLQHLPAMIKDYEPPTEASPETLIRLNADSGLEELTATLLAESYARKCDQVESALRRFE